MNYYLLSLLCTSLLKWRNDHSCDLSMVCKFRHKNHYSWFTKQILQTMAQYLGQATPQNLNLWADIVSDKCKTLFRWILFIVRFSQAVEKAKFGMQWICIRKSLKWKQISVQNMTFFPHLVHRTEPSSSCTLICQQLIRETQSWRTNTPELDSRTAVQNQRQHKRNFFNT